MKLPFFTLGPAIRELAKFVPYTGTEGDDSAPGLPIEVFVHGALCVAYSGQCLTSEALGQRSANRVHRQGAHLFICSRCRERKWKR